MTLPVQVGRAYHYANAAVVPDHSYANISTSHLCHIWLEASRPIRTLDLTSTIMHMILTLLLSSP